MCGIVGYIGPQEASGILFSGLQKLEYRGYDSAGIATVLDAQLHCIRAKGKLHNLEEKIANWDNSAVLGIGHTRWATHGKPEEHNAHPHRDALDRLAVVQNGIIENYRDLREDLRKRGCTFRSETDTEVIPHLIAEKLQVLDHPADDKSLLLEAVRQAVNCLQGAFAIAVVSADFPDELIVARQQAPLVVGYGEGEYFCASDTPALIHHTRTVLTLENQELARLTTQGVTLHHFDGSRVRRPPRTLNWNPVMVEKQGFKHFMLKEIYEQPGVVRTCLEKYLDPNWQPESGTSPVRLNLSPALTQDVEKTSKLWPVAPVGMPAWWASIC